MTVLVKFFQRPFDGYCCLNIVLCNRKLVSAIYCILSQTAIHDQLRGQWIAQIFEILLSELPDTIYNAIDSVSMILLMNVNEWFAIKVDTVM